MAWVRTATSLISFGFTIYKFFQYLREKEPGFAGDGLLGPRGFALMMIGIGLTALAVATIPVGTEWKAAAEIAALTAIVVGALVLEARRPASGS